MNLTLRELKTIRRFLGRAQALIVHVSFLVFNAGDPKTAARLNDITAVLRTKSKASRGSSKHGNFMDSVLMSLVGIE